MGIGDWGLGIPWCGLDYVALNGETIEHYAGDAALFAVGVLYGDVKGCIAQLTMNGILLERRGNAGIYLQSVEGRPDS